MASILLFGGTFDPVHLGHLAMAESALKLSHAQKCIWIPNKIPLLKDNATAKAHHRLAMLTLAIKQSPCHCQFQISQCEIKRESPSYTSETLAYFRKQYGQEQSLALLMGEDAFMQLDKWHHWQDLLNQAHIIMATRPDQVVDWPDNIKQYFAQHHAPDIESIDKTPSGHIYQITVNIPISSTAIRSQQSNAHELVAHCPPEVARYIKKHQLYL